MTEAADIVGIGARQIRRLVAAGTVPGWKIGKQWVVDEHGLEAVRNRPKSKGRPRKNGGKNQ